MIKHAPFTFIFGGAVIALLVWTAIDWRYSDRLDTMQKHIDQLQSANSELRRQKEELEKK